nr:formin-like protein 5 [Aegilops tauschii subsp. strangulata]
MEILDMPPPRIPLLSPSSPPIPTDQILLSSATTEVFPLLQRGAISVPDHRGLPPPPPASSQSTAEVLPVHLRQILKPDHAAARHSSDPTPWRPAPRNTDRPLPRPPPTTHVRCCSPPGPS